LLLSLRGPLFLLGWAVRLRFSSWVLLVEASMLSLCVRGSKGSGGGRAKIGLIEVTAWAGEHGRVLKAHALRDAFSFTGA
jgi:hypothetical protein